MVFTRYRDVNENSSSSEYSSESSSSEEISSRKLCFLFTCLIFLGLLCLANSLVSNLCLLHELHELLGFFLFVLFDKYFKKSFCRKAIAKLYTCLQIYIKFIWFLYVRGPWMKLNMTGTSSQTKIRYMQIDISLKRTL